MIRKDTDKEPVYYGTLPIQFYLAILTGYLIKTVIDLTVGTGALAQACLLKRCGHAKVSYFGICLSEAHMLAVRERLVYFVLKQMMTEGSPLYVAKCAETLVPKTPKKEPKPTVGSSESKSGGGGGGGGGSSGSSSGLKSASLLPLLGNNNKGGKSGGDNKDGEGKTNKGTKETKRKGEDGDGKDNKGSRKKGRKSKGDGSSWDLSDDGGAADGLEDDQ